MCASGRPAVRHLCDALGIERFTNNDPAISADIDSGRCYDTGNFQLEMTFRFPENSGDNITCVRGGLRWNRKDCFSADYVTLVDNGDWVERNYTTMSGNTVLILRSPSQEQGYILCDREEALMTLWLDVNLEVYSEVGGVVSVERLNMTDEQLEKVADTIDFAISPQTPTQADVDAQANFFHSATQNGYTVQLKSVETDGYVAQIRLGITAPADVDIEGLDVRIGDNSFTTAGRQLNRYSGGFDAVADGDGQSNTKDFLGEFCISFLDGLRPFALGDAWNLQIADLYADSGTSSTQVLAADIVRAVVNAVDIPVTVKMRTGYDGDNINAPELARRCEAAGAAAVTVHGRTRAQMYAPGIDYKTIKKVKNSVKIPVIGNGDVKDGKSARFMYEATGCDFLMVGRAAQGNPFVFKEINAFLNGKDYIPPTLEERFKVLTEQIKLMEKYKDPHIAMLESRKHTAWYMHGLEGAAQLRRMCGEITCFADIERICQKALELNKNV